MALPIDGEGDLTFLPYLDAHPYRDGDFLTNFDELIAQGSFFGRFDDENHHLGSFLAALLRMEARDAAEVRRELQARFEESLRDWPKRAGEAGACAFLLRDAPLIEALYERVLTNPKSEVPASVALAFNALDDHDRVQAFVDLCEGHKKILTRHAVDYLDPPTLLLRCGREYTPTLIRLLERLSQFEYNRGIEPFLDASIDRAYECLAIAPTSLSARYLLRRGEERRVTPLVLRACDAEPELMLQAALDHLAEEPRHAMAKDVATRIMRSKSRTPKAPSVESPVALPLSRFSDEAPKVLPRVLDKAPWKGSKLTTPELELSDPAPHEETRWPDPKLRDAWRVDMTHSQLDYVQPLFGPKFAKRAEWQRGDAFIEELIGHIGDGSELDPVVPFKAHLRALCESTEKRDGYTKKRYLQSGAYWLSAIDARLSLPLWNAVHPSWWKLDLESTRALIAAFGVDALDSLLARGGLAEVPADVVLDGKPGRPDALIRSALPLASSRLVPMMAQAMLGHLRDDASRWFQVHAELTVEHLLPLALRAPRDKKDHGPEGARRALQFLASIGEAERIGRVAARHGDEALRALTQLRESTLALKKAPKLPTWLDLELLPPLEDHEGSVLHRKAHEIVLGMLAASDDEHAYPPLAEVRGHCSAASRDDFVWALFREWAWAGAPTRDKWAFHALGHLGDAETCRKLASLMAQWPSDGLAARAKSGVQLLANIGSEDALFALHRFSTRAKTKALEKAAAAKIEAIAESLDLSADELADRLVPDLGLDADGRLHFDVAKNLVLSMGIDAHLAPYIIDAAGERQSTFPKQTGAYRKADKQKFAFARASFKALARDSTAVAKHALQRLESAMVQQRAWSLQSATRCFFAHPLMGELSRALLWTAEQNGTQTTFRVSEEGTFADLHDDDLDVPSDAIVRVYHPAGATPEERDAARQLLEDYELIQPFLQVERPVHSRAEFDPSSFEGAVVPSKKLYALNAAWERTPQHATKKLSAAEAILEYAPGLYGGPNASESQTLKALRIEPSLDALSSIDTSELVFDLRKLRDD